MSSTTPPIPSGDDLAWFNGLTDGERAFWLSHAGSAVPAAAWSAFKRVQAGLPPAEPAERPVRPVRPVGRPPKPADERLIGVSIRMTEAQREVLRRAGGSDAVRAWLDSLE